VRAPPDGYTLLLVNAANAINATFYDNLSLNFLRDIAPVAGIMRVPNAVLVHPSVPAKTIHRGECAVARSRGFLRLVVQKIPLARAGAQPMETSRAGEWASCSIELAGDYRARRSRCSELPFLD
jgi:Tripartite tricarboxylate transporter family receptor